MKLKLIGVPWFQFSLTGLQLSLLERLSEAHYDSVCREASACGGFLYGWRNCLVGRGRNKRAEVQATSRQLDTCLKILEMTAALSLQPREQIILKTLQSDFSCALQLANELVVKGSWVLVHETD